MTTITETPLAVAMREHNVTATKLAYELSLPSHTIRRLMDGERQPVGWVARAIADRLSATVETLFPGRDR